MENARGDVANRVVSRMAHRRDDFAQFCASLPNDQCVEFITAFREYLFNVVKNIQSSERIRALSMEFGANQVPRRSVGFKADFFAAMAEALTTEGTFLDGATHQPTEAIEAWSELVELMFSNIRDGYYQQVRYLRRSSHCFQNQQYNHSSDLSTDGSEMQMLDATIPIPTTPTTSVRH
ncbi:Protein GLB-11 [Aphelenchoides avenae]|nr:Protein GLB-11 [Aphelenchus avenae]KAH7694957.1 Protein GLB-11 [Aphelenchus avenae]